MKTNIRKFFPLIVVIALNSGNIFAQNKSIGASGPIIYEDLNYDRKNNREIFKQVKQANLEKEKLLIEDITKKSKLIGKLAKAKFFILNGNFERARVDLLNIKEKDPYIEVVKKRYKAILHFLEGNHQRSLEALNDKLFSDLNSYTKTCHLKILNKLVLDQTKEVRREWEKCRKYTRSREHSEAFWFSLFVDLRTNLNKISAKQKIQSLKSLGYNEELVKIYLKAALFLNQEKEVLKFVEAMPEEFFEVDQIRELLGHLYYRSGQLALAYDFLEDLTSPNAENIKGNVYLAQKKYELAYAQFKLALNKKEDSLNAIERALPLSWILKQWQDGHDFTKRLSVSNISKVKKQALEVAFLIHLGEFDKAQDLLEKMTLFSKYAQPFEVNQLYSYVALIQGKMDKAKIYADLACKKLDLLACWTLVQSSIWENFSQVVTSEQEISYNSVSVLNALKTQAYDDPIDEELYIDQKDIEELDNDLIQIKAN